VRHDFRSAEESVDIVLHLDDVPVEGGVTLDAEAFDGFELEDEFIGVVAGPAAEFTAVGGDDDVVRFEDGEDVVVGEAAWVCDACGISI